MSAAVPWGDFTADPRRAETAGLRASDRDRDVALNVLGEGYALGRLTKQEYDERADAAAATRTLGELTPLIVDLVPAQLTRTAHDELVGATSEDLHVRAVTHWQRERAQALTGLLIPSVICWVIWALTMPGGFAWPVFVMLGTGVNLLRVLAGRQEIVAQEQRRLEKKQRKALEPPRGEAVEE